MTIPYLATASWVFSEIGWFQGGGVVVSGKTGYVLEAGKPDLLLSKWNIPGDRVREYPSCILFPGIVNAHTHLELSAIGKFEPPKDYFSWVRELIKARCSTSLTSIKRAFREAILTAYCDGTWLFGDITNTPILTDTNSIESSNKKPNKNLEIFSENTLIKRHIFWELLGFLAHDIVDALSEEQRRYFLRWDYTTGISLVPHAVYSTSSRLITQTHRWCRSRGRPFCIHVGEHEHEVEFLLRGEGPCRDLLEKLDKWDPNWTPPKMRPVAYLDSLGVLDAQTLLVHCIHFSEEDWQIVRNRGCTVCFCARSNNFLKVGQPSIEEAFHRKITVLLGTDSLASTTDLNMFKEISFLIDKYPGISPTRILLSATFAGASFFTQHNHLPYLVIPYNEGTKAKNIEDILIEQGIRGGLRWLIGDLG